MLAGAAMSPSLALAAPANRDASALAKYVGRTIFVEHRTRDEFKGRLLAILPDGLRMTAGLGERALTWSEVRRVFLEGDRLSDGIDKGVAIGLGLGLLGTQGMSCRNCPGRTLASIAVSAAVYGAIGAWIDHRNVGRTLVYVAPD